MLGRGWLAGLLMCGMAIGQAPVASAPGEAAKPDAAVERQFDAVSIKLSGSSESGGWGTGPGGFQMKSQTLHTAVMMAYFPMTRMFGYAASPISAEPDWVKSDHYTIEAKFDEATAQAFKSAKGDQRGEMLRPMLQAMLADRCKLVAHMKMVDGPVYELVVARHGLKMKQTAPGEAPPEHAIQIEGDAMMVPIYPKPAKDQLTFFHASTAALATFLSTAMDRQVVDRTGLSGKYDLVVPRIQQDETEAAGAASDPNESMLRWDLSEAGLELRPAKAPQPMLVIDHIERPTAN